MANNQAEEMALVLTKKAKCMYCAALTKFIGEDKKEAYGCGLGFGIDWKQVRKNAVSPVPLEPCYKPLTKKAVNVAKRKISESTNA